VQQKREDVVKGA